MAGKKKRQCRTIWQRVRNGSLGEGRRKRRQQEKGWKEIEKKQKTRRKKKARGQQHVYWLVKPLHIALPTNRKTNATGNGTSSWDKLLDHQVQSSCLKTACGGMQHSRWNFKPSLCGQIKSMSFFYRNGLPGFARKRLLLLQWVSVSKLFGMKWNVKCELGLIALITATSLIDTALVGSQQSQVEARLRSLHTRPSERQMLLPLKWVPQSKQPQNNEKSCSGLWLTRCRAYTGKYTANKE